MKKKMLWGSTILVIGVICFITYKIGTNFYKKYQFQKWEEEYQAMNRTGFVGDFFI